MATEVSDGEAEVEIVGVEVEFRSRKGEVRFPVEPFSTSMPWWARFSLSTHGISPWDEPPLIFEDVARGKEQEWEDQVAVPLRRFCGKLTTTADQGIKDFGMYFVMPVYVAFFLILLLLYFQNMTPSSESGSAEILQDLFWVALAVAGLSTIAVIIARRIGFANLQSNNAVIGELNQFFSQSMRFGLLSGARDVSRSIRMMGDPASDLIEIVVYLHEGSELVREHARQREEVERRQWERTIRSRPSVP